MSDVYKDNVNKKYEVPYGDPIPRSQWYGFTTSGPAPAPTVQSAFDVQVGGQHYAKWKIQPLQYILANKIPFLEGNVIKYVTRWRDKAGVQDLEKARHYLDLLIETEKNKND